MIQKISAFLLKLAGWKTSNTDLPSGKYIILGAPHTSNWDFPIALLTLGALGLRFSWAVKDSFFFFPLGSLCRLMGGVPVNRKIRNAFLQTMVSEFKEREQFIIAIAPEGTRSFTDHWKCGFYQIAIEAQVDIGLAFADYETKRSGIGKVFTPSGDLEKDFEIIKSFYAGKKGKFPEKTSTIALRPKELRFFIRQQKKKQQSDS